MAAIGNPHGRANTVTFGVVSAKDQSIRVKGRFEKLGPLVETDAAINGGNSGGAAEASAAAAATLTILVEARRPS